MLPKHLRVANASAGAVSLSTYKPRRLHRSRKVGVGAPLRVSSSGRTRTSRTRRPSHAASSFYYQTEGENNLNLLSCALYAYVDGCRRQHWGHSKAGSVGELGSFLTSAPSLQPLFSLLTFADFAARALTIHHRRLWQRTPNSESTRWLCSNSNQQGELHIKAFYET